MLHALINHFDRCIDENGNKLSTHTQSVLIQSIIRCNSNGKPIDVVPIDKPGKAIDVPTQVKRASGIAANLLVDNLEYLIGIKNDKQDQKSLEKLEAFRDLNLSILDSNIQIGSCAESFKKFLELDPQIFLDFYQRNKDNLAGSSWIGLEFAGDLIVEDPYLKERAIKHNSSNDDARFMTSIISGVKEPIAKLHPAVKNLFAGQTAGTNLISFNEKSTSTNGTNEEQGYLAPIGITDASKISQTLSFLIKNNNNRVDMINILSFSNVSEKAEAIVNGILGYSGSTEKEELNSSDNIDDEFNFGPGAEEERDITREVTGIIRSIRSGYRPSVINTEDYHPDEPFYIIGLQPNASRISTLFYYEDSFNHLVENFTRFYSAAELDTGNQYFSPNLRWLIRAHKLKTNKSNKTIRKTETALVESMIFGRNLPRSFYQEVLERVQKRSFIDRSKTKDRNEDRKLERNQISYIKAYLILNDKSGKNKKEFTMSLNKECKLTPYLLGRLFAACDWAEHKDDQTAMRYKLQRKASNNPASVYPHILEMTNIRVRNNTGLAVNTDKLIQEILDKFEETTFPAVLHAEDQGAWWLGYYQQRQDLFKQAAKKKTLEEARKAEEKAKTEIVKDHDEQGAE